MRLPSHALNDGAHLPCRIGKTINRFADRVLRCRVLFQLTVRTLYLSSDDRIPWRIQSPRASNQVRSAPSVSTSAEEVLRSSLPKQYPTDDERDEGRPRERVVGMQSGILWVAPPVSALYKTIRSLYNDSWKRRLHSYRIVRITHIIPETYSQH